MELLSLFAPGQTVAVIIPTSLAGVMIALTLLALACKAVTELRKWLEVRTWPGPDRSIPDADVAGAGQAKAEDRKAADAAL